MASAASLRHQFDAARLERIKQHYPDFTAALATANTAASTCCVKRFQFGWLRRSEMLNAPVRRVRGGLYPYRFSTFMPM